MEKSASGRLPSDGLSSLDTGIYGVLSCPGWRPPSDLPHFLLALPALPRTPQTVDAATPLPAWRPDFSDGAPFVGPFVRAVRAAYVAHAWIRKNAALFPVTLLGSASSSASQLGLPAGSQSLGKESTAAHWAAALWKSAFHKKSTKLKGPATTPSAELKGHAAQSTKLKGSVAAQPTGTNAEQHLTTGY